MVSLLLNWKSRLFQNLNMMIAWYTLHTANLNTQSAMIDNKRGLLSVFGAFLIQLCIGCYHGTFGNMLPYLTSYMKQVSLENKVCFKKISLTLFCKRCSLPLIKIMLICSIIQSNPDLTHGDLAMIFSTGGLSQGVSYLLGLWLLFIWFLLTSQIHIPGGLILVPLLGSRRSLILGCFLFCLAPVLTYFTLNVSVPLISCTYGLLNGFAVNIIQLGENLLFP